MTTFKEFLDSRILAIGKKKNIRFCTYSVDGIIESNAVGKALLKNPNKIADSLPLRTYTLRFEEVTPDGVKKHRLIFTKKGPKEFV